MAPRSALTVDTKARHGWAPTVRPDTPTLAESVGDRHADLTFSLGLYGHGDMPAEAAERIHLALEEVAADPEIVGAPIHADVPLNLDDGQVLQEAFECDLRLLKRRAIRWPSASDRVR